MDDIILYLNAIDIPAWIIKGGKLVFINEILGNDFQTNIEQLNNIKTSNDGNSSIIKDLYNAIYNLPYKNNLLTRIGNFNYRLKVANLANDVCIVSLIKISELISSELLQNCIDSIPDIIFYKDENLKYKIINKKCKLFYESMGIQDVTGKNDLELPLEENFIKTCNKHDLMAINSGKAVYMEEKVPKSGSDEFYIYQTIKAPIIGEDEIFYGVVGLARDVTDYKLTEERLMDLNNKLSKSNRVDHLTGLYNRRYLEEVRDKYSFTNKKLTFIMADIDYFKPYNDNYGHIRGDNALLNVSKVLKSTFKSDLVFRVGGEEFLIISSRENLNDIIDDVELLYKNIYDLNIPHNYSGVSDRVTLSMGVATTLVKSDDDLDILHETSDKMLYESKRNGRNRYSVENLYDKLYV